MKNRPNQNYALVPSYKKNPLAETRVCKVTFKKLRLLYEAFDNELSLA